MFRAERTATPPSRLITCQEGTVYFLGARRLTKGQGAAGPIRRVCVGRRAGHGWKDHHRAPKRRHLRARSRLRSVFTEAKANERRCVAQVRGLFCALTNGLGEFAFLCCSANAGQLPSFEWQISSIRGKGVPGHSHQPKRYGKVCATKVSNRN